MRMIIQYIWGMIPYCFVGAIICTIFRLLYHKKANTKMEWKREVLMILFAAYAAGLASQTIMPKWDAGIAINTGPYFHIYLENSLSSVNIIPFKTVRNELIGNNSSVASSEVRQISTLNLFANLLLFSPLGFFLPMLSEKFRTVRKIVLVGIMISTCVEILQYFIGRSSDIDDIILNTIGVGIGFAIYKCMTGIFQQQPGQQGKSK